jgi:hypothetical protein
VFARGRQFGPIASVWEVFGASFISKVKMVPKADEGDWNGKTVTRSHAVRALHLIGAMRRPPAGMMDNVIADIVSL